MPTSATFDLAEGPDGDILVMSRLISGIDLILQRVRRRVDRFLGDWILDASIGLPYFEWSQQKPPQTQAIGARIRAEIEKTTGVSGVTGWMSTFDRATRSLSFADYRHAPGGDGPLAAEWRNKPHRLIYELAAEVTRLRIEAGCCGVCGRPGVRCVCPPTCAADCDCRGFA